MAWRANQPKQKLRKTIQDLCRVVLCPLPLCSLFQIDPSPTPYNWMKTANYVFSQSVSQSVKFSDHPAQHWRCSGVKFLFARFFQKGQEKKFLIMYGEFFCKSKMAKLSPSYYLFGSTSSSSFLTNNYEKLLKFLFCVMSCGK